jgi:hypothetical protein
VRICSNQANWQRASGDSGWLHCLEVMRPSVVLGGGVVSTSQVIGRVSSTSEIRYNKFNPVVAKL